MTDFEAATSFLGEWGPFQRQVFFLICLTVVPNGFTGLSVVFVADTPAHRCHIPAHVNLSAAWRNHSAPLVAEGGGRGRGRAPVPSSCSRYKLEQLLDYSERGLLPGVDVNLSSLATEGCVDGWDYDRSVYLATIITEWDLVCDNRWKNPLTSSVFFCGVLVGSFASGQLSDRYGRKKVLFATMAVHTVFMFLMSFSPSWTVFCILYFIVGIGHISNYMTAFVLGAELLSPRVRTVFSTAGVSLFFAVGYMMLPMVAFFLRDWRKLLIGLNAPGFFFAPLWWFIPESPRWLVSQGRLEEAEAIVRRAAKKNKIEAPRTIFSPIQKELQSDKTKSHNICDLLRSSNIRWISVTLWLVWIILSVAYYGLSLNTSNLHGNVYFNCFLSALIEMPAYILSWLLFRWCSRRLTMFGNFLTGAVFLFFVQLIPGNLIYLAITLEMLGKFAITTAFALVYAYTAEVYPTVLRNTAMGSCSMAARIGSIIAPYFIYLRSYSVALPYILMGSLTTLSALLSLLVPESFGMPMPDTITHMQPFPGCCKKTLYTLTQTAEEERAPEKKASSVSSSNA